MGAHKRLWAFLRKPSARYSLGAILFGGVVIGIFTMLSTITVFSATNSLEFCISCHEMEQVVYQEYKESAHYKNASGVRAECSDCHVPKGFTSMIKAKIFAAKDIWHTILGSVDTPEKFEEKRWVMASRVWKMLEESDSGTCRSCHEFNSMDLEAQPKLARKKHGRAMQKGGKTCIDCHRGLVHEEPMEPDDESDESV